MRLKYLSWGKTAVQSFNSRTPGGVRRSILTTAEVAEAFQFTHPGRGATATPKLLHDYPLVSIHAPREGCDTSTDLSSSRINGFNSRTPGGVRLCGSAISSYLGNVSIHAPREGCDSYRSRFRNGSLSFNSRTPGGVRLSKSVLVRVFSVVSIHAPREGCDFTYCLRGR